MDNDTELAVNAATYSIVSGVVVLIEGGISQSDLLEELKDLLGYVRESLPETVAEAIDQNVTLAYAQRVIESAFS